MVEGLSHITFIVSDLDKTENLLTTVLSAEKIYDSKDKNFSLSEERFFLIAGLWVAIMKGEPLAEASYNHIAFKISQKDYDNKLKQVRALGLNIREGRSRINGEGQSIYFHDYDNHLIELHTGTLQERLKRYAAKD